MRIVPKLVITTAKTRVPKRKAATAREGDPALPHRACAMPRPPARTRLSNEQLSLLETCFRENRLPNRTDVTSIGILACLPFHVTLSWFYNARARRDGFRSPRPVDSPLCSSDASCALVAVLLREENPSWSAPQVAMTARTMVAQGTALREYVAIGVDAFVLRAAARVLMDDPAVDPDDAMSIAMTALVLRTSVVEGVPTPS